MRVLVAPQDFKGTLTAVEAARAIARGVQRAQPAWSLEVLPIADGGPGTLEVLLAARGGRAETRRVQDPLGREVEARFAVLEDGRAVIEMAEASGLWRLSSVELDPRSTSTFGTGQLIASALDEGCGELLIGVGGSATNDGGAGALKALGFRFFGVNGDTELPPGGAALQRLERIDSSQAHPALRRGVRLRVATDVRNPLLGEHGATCVYGPQKGADARAVQELEASLRRFADVVAAHTRRDLRAEPGTGAAGGLSFGLAALANAELVSGFEEVSSALSLPARIAASDLVLTGEGRLDAQTHFGKGPHALAQKAREAGRPIICFAGRVGAEEARTGFDQIVEVGSSTALPTGAEAALALEEAAFRWAAESSPSR